MNHRCDPQDHFDIKADLKAALLTCLRSNFALLPLQSIISEVHSVVQNEVFRTRVEVINSKLRALMCLEAGREVHYDVQVWTRSSLCGHLW